MKQQQQLFIPRGATDGSAARIRTLRTCPRCGRSIGPTPAADVRCPYKPDDEQGT